MAMQEVSQRVVGWVKTSASLDDPALDGDDSIGSRDGEISRNHVSGLYKMMIFLLKTTILCDFTRFMRFMLTTC